MRLLATGQALNVIVTKNIAIAEAGGTRIRVVEVPLGLVAVSVVCTTEVAEMRTLALVLHLAELSECTIWAVLVLTGGRGRRVEVGSLCLAEIR